MTISLTVLSICCGLFLIGYLYREVSILKGVTLGVTLFSFVYVISSAILFWMDWYSILKASVLTSVILLCGVIICLIKKITFKFIVVPKEWAVMAIVIALVLPFTIQKFEFFGMGQDQGGYQTKAINLIYGETDRISDFDELEVLESEEQIENYIAAVRSIPGHDNLLRNDGTSPFLENVEDVSRAAGIYHGIPTWPAILALYGDMFGISHMQDVQTIILIVYLGIVFYALENLGIRTILEMPALLMLGLSPQILWVSKSGLTEVYLALIMACFAMLILEKNKYAQACSFMPIIIFSIYHVTAFTMIPMFLLICWGMYLMCKEKYFLYNANIGLIGYFVGYIFMTYISPGYTRNNYVAAVSSILPVINHSNLRYLVCVAVVCGLLITNLIPWIEKNRLIRNIGEEIYQKRNYILKVIMAILLCAFFLMCFMNDATIVEESNIIYNIFGSRTLFAYLVASAGLLLPTIFFVFIGKKKNLKGANIYALLIIFIYTILVYSLILRKDVGYYYYYGRYLIPFFFIIYLVFCYFANSIKRYYICLVCFLGVVFFIEPNYLLLTEVDDSRISWSIVEEVTELVNKENVATIISGDLQRTLFLPIGSTSSDVYNEWNDLDSQMEFLEERYETVYYVSTNSTIDEYSLLYRKENSISHYHDTYFSYPVETTKERSEIAVYKNQKVSLEYDIIDYSFEGTGFGMVEQNKFAWTNNERVDVITYIKEDNYLVTLKQATGIPLNNLGYEDYKIDVFFNDVYIDTMVINKDNNGKDITFCIPKELITKKRNIVSFESELWSPSDFGQNDGRRVGFAFESLEFAPIEKKMEYHIDDEGFAISGIHDVENSKYAWTNSEDVKIFCGLDKDNYELVLTMGTLIPLEELGWDEYEIELFVNGEYCAFVSINRDAAKKLHFQIPSDVLENGINEIKFRSKLWSPLDFGSADNRELGFCISKIKFIPMDEN